MSDDVNMEAVCRRIKKLLAIASDSRGSAEEAAAAAMMAQKVMAKFKLEHQDILISELRSGDNFGEALHEPTNIAKAVKLGEIRWFGRLAVAVCKANDAHCEFFGQSVKLYGVKSDVEVSGYMLDYLSSQIQLIAQAYYTLTKSVTKTIDFRLGMVQTVCKVLPEQSAPVSTGNALVVAKSAAVQEHFGKVMTTVACRTHETSANTMGRQAGMTIDVGRRGVGSSPSGSLRIAA